MVTAEPAVSPSFIASHGHGVLRGESTRLLAEPAEFLLSPYLIRCDDRQLVNVSSDLVLWRARVHRGRLRSGPVSGGYVTNLRDNNQFSRLHQTD